MNIKIIAGMLGVVSLLTASLVNASSINVVQLGPDPVPVGDPFGVMIEGVFGVDQTYGGAFTLTWDDTVLSLETTALEIVADVNANDFASTEIGNVVITANSLFVNAFTLSFGTVGLHTGTFDVISSLIFSQVPPAAPGETVATLLGVEAQPWTDESFTQITPDFNSATITIGAVPIPSAVWLFASGLIGMVGIARRRTTQLA